jgi:hypothetical protein
MTIGCRSRQARGHLGKNIQQTTHWRVLEPIFERPGAMPRKTLDNGHDVGSEYALYMVGGLEKIAVFSRRAARPPALTLAPALPIRPRVPERTRD